MVICYYVSLLFLTWEISKSHFNSPISHTLCLLVFLMITSPPAMEKLRFPLLILGKIKYLSNTAWMKEHLQLEDEIELSCFDDRMSNLHGQWLGRDWHIYYHCCEIYQPDCNQENRTQFDHRNKGAIYQHNWLLLEVRKHDRMTCSLLSTLWMHPTAADFSPLSFVLWSFRLNNFNLYSNLLF